MITKRRPTAGVLALAWLWRLTAPRGHGMIRSGMAPLCRSDCKMRCDPQWLLNVAYPAAMSTTV